MNDENEYIPAGIIEGDRTLATHCETFLLFGEMKQEDRMARITQSIADYREHHAARAREPVNKMLRDHLGTKFESRRDIENMLLSDATRRIASRLTPRWQRPILRWAMRKLISPTVGA